MTRIIRVIRVIRGFILGNMKFRLERVREVLKRELGVIMGREIRFTSPLVTINDVDITPDLKQAHIFVSVIGDAAQHRDALEKTRAQSRPPPARTRQARDPQEHAPSQFQNSTNPSSAAPA